MFRAAAVFGVVAAVLRGAQPVEDLAAAVESPETPALPDPLDYLGGSAPKVEQPPVFPDARPPPPPFGDPWYDYRVRGEDWAAGQCGSRKRQSPIDLPAPATLGLPAGDLPFQYAPITAPFDLQNNGHAIAADLSNRGYGGLTLDDCSYSLQSIVFHARSEHSIVGKRSPLEVHLVHKRDDGDALAITAFLVESPTSPRPEEGIPKGFGNAPDDFALSFFTSPPAVSEKASVEPTELRPLDFNSWYTGRFYAYEGSLTAPPCSENVQWFVRQTPLKASNEQVNSLFQALFMMTHDLGNARAPMPLAARTVKMLNAVRGEPLPAHGTQLVNQHGAMRPFQADSDAIEAKKTVLKNREKLQDLDGRIKAAAAEEAQAYQGLEPMVVRLARGRQDYSGL